MKVIKTISTMREYATRWQRAGNSVGFVPTMGALHGGHRALIAAARQTNTIVVVSLFVNPLQFSPREDLQRYPRSLTQDQLLCEQAEADVLFVPSRNAMYPDGFQTTVLVHKVTQGYEGQSRPTHFEGVSTVVTKLCHIVAPNRVYFGQKDYQQAIVVQQMLIDLNMPIKMVVRPTVREPDGLAMSSRNTHLKPSERGAAMVIYRAVQEGSKQIRLGERSGAKICGAIERVLKTEAMVNVDYVRIMHPDTLEKMKTITGRVVLALAVYIGKTRLIDNAIVRVPTL